MKRRKDILETPNRRRRKRRRAILGVILFILAIGVIIAGIVMLLRLPSLRVSKVSISGAAAVDQSSLQADAASLSSGYFFYFIPKDFVLFYPSKEIASAIMAKHGEISAAEVRVRGASSVEIIVSERSPEALYCIASCFFFDASGLVYREATSTSGFVRFSDARMEHQAGTEVGSRPLATQTFKDAKHFAESLAQLGLHLREVRIEAEGDMSVLTEEGRLIVSSEESFAEQLDFLKTALAQDVFKNPDDTVHSFGYIDLRFGKKIFYRLSGTEYQATSTATSTPAPIVE